MSVIDRIMGRKPKSDKSELAATAPEPAKTKGVAIVDTAPTKWYEKSDRDKKTLDKWETVYLQGGIASQCIDAYVYYILSNGHRFESEDDSSLAKVEEFFDMVDMDTVIECGIKDALVFGRCFQEIGNGMGSKSNTPVLVNPLPAKYFEVLTDKKGKVTGYKQVLYDPMTGMPTTSIPFTPDEILSFKLFDMSGSKYGCSLVQRSLDDIMHYAKISEATATAILRHGFPRYHIRVGREGERPDPIIFQQVDSEFRNLDAKNELVTNYDVVIENLDKNALPNIEDIVTWATSNLCVSLGVPEVAMGLGRGSTEASSYEEMQAFYDRISMLQKKIARCYQPLIDRITGKPGAVKFIFNDANPSDESTKADWVYKLTTAYPPDPAYYLPRQFVWDLFNIDPDLYEEGELREGQENEPVDEGMKEAYYDALNTKRQDLMNPKDKVSPGYEPKSEDDKQPDK
jgi:hypothetical protein